MLQLRPEELLIGVSAPPEQRRPSTPHMSKGMSDVDLGDRPPPSGGGLPVNGFGV